MSSALLDTIDAVQRARRQSDPLWQFIPHPVQQRFIDSVLQRTYYENWLIAANRVGKSDAMAYCLAHFFRYGIPDPRAAVGPSGVVYDRAISGWVVGPDYQTLQRAIMPKLFDNGYVAKGASHPPFIPAYEIAGYNRETQTLTGRNGSMLQFKSNEQSQIKFSAQGVDIIGFDEEPPMDNYEEATLRIEAGQRLHIMGACTLLPPEGMVGGVSWLFTKLIQPVVAKRITNIGLFGGSIYDNPHLAPEEILRLESKYPEDSVQRRIRLNGEWLPGLGGARKYGSFQPTAHVRPQGPPNPYLPLCWAWDFNVEPFCSVVFQYDKQVFHVLRELVMEEGDIAGMCDLFRATFPKHPHELWIYGDASGKDRSHQTRKSSYTIILEHMLDYGYTRLKIPQVNPFVTERVDAVNVMLRGPNGEIRIVIDPQCEELIADLLEVKDDGRGGIKKITNRRDPYFRRTHASDALGYAVVFECPVTIRSEWAGVSNVDIPMPVYNITRSIRRR